MQAQDAWIGHASDLLGLCDMAAPEGIIFEYRTVGSYRKVSAVDTATGTEVAVMGPLSAARSDLEAVAARKLRYVLEKQQTR